MEKDYFKDRTKIATQNDYVLLGDIVYICLKDKQKTAKDINDLTKIIVCRKLTSKKFHPRGIKVLGYEIPHDVYPNKASIQQALAYYQEHKAEIDAEDNTPIANLFAKGRIVYICNYAGEIMRY